LGITYAALGGPARAEEAFAEAGRIFRGIDHHVFVAFTLLAQLHDVAITFAAAAPGARRRVAAEAEAALGRAGGVLRPGVSPQLAWLGAYVLDGRWDEARRILDNLPEPGHAYLRREVSTAAAVLAANTGDASTAWAYVNRLFPDGATTAPGDHILQEGLLMQRLSAQLCLDVGDLSGARSWLEGHDAWLTWSGSRLGQADGGVSWARYHLVCGDAALALVRAGEALAAAEEPQQPLARLAAHRLLGEIEAADGNLPEAERHLLTALDLAAACEAPFERALTLLPLIALHAAAGRTEAALPLLAEAREIGQRLGAAPLLARLDTLAARPVTRSSGPTYPAGLTQREVDILRLLAQRQTDKEIADALFMSYRTVQSHVTHMLTKLGVDNRREAAAAAAKLDLL
jgi:DNA-binding CsgD family transcriptional regulator